MSPTLPKVLSLTNSPICCPISCSLLIPISKPLLAKDSPVFTPSNRFCILSEALFTLSFSLLCIVLSTPTLLYRNSLTPFNASSRSILPNTSLFFCFTMSGSAVFFTISDRATLVVSALAFSISNSFLLVYREWNCSSNDFL